MALQLFAPVLEGLCSGIFAAGWQLVSIDGLNTTIP